MGHCPICYSALESRTVAPCWDCGHLESELADFAAGMHTYGEYRAFGQYPVILCNFCLADFGSYDPRYFSLPEKIRSASTILEFARNFDPPALPVMDGYCDECRHRLAFLRFVVAVRNRNEAAAPDANRR